MSDETTDSKGSENGNPPAPEAPTPSAPASAPGPEVRPDGTVDPVKRGHTWGTVCHLSALAGYAGVPLGYVLGPLVVWLCTRDKYAYADDQGKEALNFQLTVLVLTLVCLPLICLCVGVVLLAALHLFNLIFIVVAAIKASRGEAFRYPLCIRFLR